MNALVRSEIEQELRSDKEVSPELDDLMRNARRASDFLKALSHENRLLLLCLLSEGERSVSELEGALAMRQSAVSQQLARLRLANEDVRRMITVIYDIFCGCRTTSAADTA
jgi:DNA-binding MarR family transcriptional regulator